MAPFTFDGFPFGLGGYAPINQGIDPYSTLINNVIFRNIFNGGLGEFLGQGLSNSVDLTRYLPSEVTDVLDDDVVTLLGYDFVDRFIGQYLTLPSAEAGERIPGGCIVSIMEGLRRACEGPQKGMRKALEGHVKGLRRACQGPVESYTSHLLLCCASCLCC